MITISWFTKSDQTSTEERLYLIWVRYKNILKELKEYNKYKTEDVDLEPLITRLEQIAQLILNIRMLMLSFLSVLRNHESYVPYKIRHGKEKVFYKFIAYIASSARTTFKCIHGWVKRGKRRIQRGSEPNFYSRWMRQLTVREMNMFMTMTNEDLIKMHTIMRQEIGTAPRNPDPIQDLRQDLKEFLPPSC
ncbi:hypothetical protein K505DRAFT_336570 [Melanomma pulvis-pyrius CBS 109.77]|uniref:Uncharacterized protein n=1 Tax=Melanomma pulvis-pyrius CBS 109.77 TaxID=1314802 RepID=A0A6A6XEU1_9PLEO|nr:hypothetical protein K505DRAFT_336570 [Melanomma pulvis-pyrius CBS 109.77]